MAIHSRRYLNTSYIFILMQSESLVSAHPTIHDVKEFIHNVNVLYSS